MDRQLLLHKMILEELYRCEHLQQELEKKLKILPKGSVLNRNGHMYRAYRENGKQYQVPIHNDNKMLDELILRRYIKEGLPSLKTRTKLCKDFLKKERYYDHEKIRSSLNESYKTGKCQSLLLEHDIDLSTWLNSPYKRNPAAFAEEHYTANGVQVRSKSESLIGSALEQRGLLFRCEPEIWCGNQNYYPDFVIFLPNIRRIIYLEHFGKMGDPGYVKKTMKKLKDYQQHGLYLGINFFFTWETLDCPLNMREVHEVLDEIQALDVA